MKQLLVVISFMTILITILSPLAAQNVNEGKTNDDLLKDILPYFRSRPLFTRGIFNESPKEETPRVPLVTTERSGQDRPIVNIMRDHIDKFRRRIHSFGSPARGSWASNEDSDFAPGHGFSRRPISPNFHRNIFRNIFGTQQNQSLNPFFQNEDFGSLPPNYKNSTSRVHYQDGSKVTVNQTVHKRTGDNSKHFYHFRVIRITPHNGTEETPVPDYGETVTQIPTIDDSYNEVEIDSLIPPDSNDSKDEFGTSSFDSLQGNTELNRQTRRNFASHDRVTNHGRENRMIHLPARNPTPRNHRIRNASRRKRLTRMPNNFRVKPGVSYVYNDLNGNSYLYRITHVKDNVFRNSVSHKGVYPKEKPKKDIDVEVVGPIRPPDLSRDTRVNPDGSSSSQQGLTQVDPDAEVFDLSLVIKEMESRANN